MKATLRLTATYFTATPMVLGFTVVGIIAYIFSIFIVIWEPSWIFVRFPGDAPIWKRFVYTAALTIFMFLPLVASIRIPATVVGLLSSKRFWAFSGARFCLLLSIVIPVSVYALLMAVYVWLMFRDVPLEFRPEGRIEKAFVVAFMSYGFMLICFWMIGKAQGIWRVISMLPVLMILSFATQAISRGPVDYYQILVWVGVTGWVGFAVCVIYGRSLRQCFKKKSLTSFLPSMFLPPEQITAGSDGDLSGNKRLKILMGASRPWIVALGQIVPIILAYLLLPESDEATAKSRTLLMYLIVLSAITGAITSNAAKRCRNLWLRLGMSREEVFRNGEKNYWQYCSYSLAMLVLAFIVISHIIGASHRFLFLGMPLLILGSAVSFYLGFIITKSLGLLEATLAIVTMSMLVGTVFVVAAVNVHFMWIVLLESLLLVLIFVYRALAKSRWQGLDWMLCK